MNFLLKIILTIVFLSIQNQTLRIKTKKLKKKLKKKHLSRIKAKKDNYNQYEQSWINYFKYNPSNMVLTEENLVFFQNQAFLEQQKKPYDQYQTDNNGPINIPDLFSFYLIMINKKLQILNSRRDSLSKTIDILDCSQVTASYRNEFGIQEGGIQNFFTQKKGYCLKVNTVNGAQNQVSVFCFKTEIQKDDWYSALRECSDNLLLKEYEPQYNAEAVIGGSLGRWDQYSYRFKQDTKLRSEIQMRDNYRFKQYPQLGPDGQTIQTLISQTDLPTKDGYWIIINDWSSCTLKCGGGTQTQQRQCVPPKRGGKACMGQEILTKPCNTQPCAEQYEGQTLPLAVKTIQFSQRPMREERCIIKEGDLDIVRDDLDQFKQKPRLPSRVVLNNRTFSIFDSDNFEDILFSVPLNDLQIQNSFTEICCLQLIDKRTRKEKTICPMNGQDQIKTIENWKDQILFFQNNCHVQLPIFSEYSEIVKLKEKQVNDEKNYINYFENSDYHDKPNRLENFINNGFRE